jgi:hypothetical protein
MTKTQVRRAYYAIEQKAAKLVFYQGEASMSMSDYQKIETICKKYLRKTHAK